VRYGRVFRLEPCVRGGENSRRGCGREEDKAETMHYKGCVVETIPAIQSDKGKRMQKSVVEAAGYTYTRGAVKES
jgi:hypothetical protein